MSPAPAAWPAGPSARLLHEEGRTQRLGALGMLSAKDGRRVSGEKANVWARVAMAEIREGSRSLAGS